MAPDSQGTFEPATLPGNGYQPGNPVTTGMPEPIQRSYSWQVAANLFVSFKYAWAGISYAFRTQRNFKIHVLVGSTVLSLSLPLGLAPVEIAVLGLTVGAVMALELINTALESVVDLTVQQNYHELAKIAKDCAAGAVLISSLVSIVVGASLLLPPIWRILQLQLI